MHDLLLAAEVALSLLLLTCSGLLTRSFVLQRQVDLGIRGDNLLTTRISLSSLQYRSAGSQARFLRALLNRLGADRGVVAAGISTDIPPYSVLNTKFDIPGAGHPNSWSGHIAASSSQWFATVGSRLMAGRVLTVADENARRRVVVINHTLAEKYFGARNPIGQLLHVDALNMTAEPIRDPWFEIVGIISDIRNEGTRKDVLPEAYLPYTIEAFGGYTVFVRTLGKAEAMVPDLAATVLASGSGVTPQYTWSMERILELNEYSRPRFFMILVAVFAVIGLARVSVGIYSVIFYRLLQRRKEIGIRMALGATAGTIRLNIIAVSLRSAYVGAGLGIAVALMLSHIVASQIWGVVWYDPVTLGGVLLLLSVVEFSAAYAASVRVSRVAPVICLRDE